MAKDKSEQDWRLCSLRIPFAPSNVTASARGTHTEHSNPGLEQTAHVTADTTSYVFVFHIEGCRYWGEKVRAWE